MSFTISEAPPSRLDKALARDVPVDANLSRSRIAKLLVDGKITVNGVVALDQKAKVAEGDEIAVTVPEANESHIGPEDIPLDIVFEDDDLIIVNKPVGMVVHPAPGSPNGTLVNALLHHCGDTLAGVGGEKRPGIVHRIDKDTSGLLVVAKNDETHHGLAKQFEAHTVERYYQAVVYGTPDANDPRLRGVKGVNFETGNIMKVTTQLARHKHDRQRQAVLFNGGRHAVTRVRMAHAGHSLVGDPTYGGKRKISPKSLSQSGIMAVSNFKRQALHAAVLGFTHPVTKEKIRFEAPLPADLTALLKTVAS